MACGREPAGVTAIPLGRRLPGASSNLPGRQGLDRTPKYLCAFAQKPSRRPYSVLLPVGFAVPPALPPARCALTAPFHPYRGLIRNAPRRSVLCGTFPGLAPAGRYPAPFVHGARTFLPGHLSVSAGAAVRPTDEDRDGDASRRRQGAWRQRCVQRLAPAPRCFAAGCDARALRRSVLQRRRIGDAIDALRPEMALECRHHLMRRGIEHAVGGDAVAVLTERFLQRRDRFAAIAEREHRTSSVIGAGLHPMADAGIVQRAPRKFFAGILLARRRDIRMREHACRAGSCGG